MFKEFDPAVVAIVRDRSLEAHHVEPMLELLPACGGAASLRALLFGAASHPDAGASTVAIASRGRQAARSVE